jgi:hypothetical protein
MGFIMRGKCIEDFDFPKNINDFPDELNSIKIIDRSEDYSKRKGLKLKLRGFGCESFSILSTKPYHCCSFSDPIPIGVQEDMFEMCNAMREVIILPPCPLISVLPSIPVLNVIQREKCMFSFTVLNIGSVTIDYLDIECNINEVFLGFLFNVFF